MFLSLGSVLLGMGIRLNNLDLVNRIILEQGYREGLACFNPEPVRYVKDQSVERVLVYANLGMPLQLELTDLTFRYYRDFKSEEEWDKRVKDVGLLKAREGELITVTFYLEDKTFKVGFEDTEDYWTISEICESLGWKEL